MEGNAWLIFGHWKVLNYHLTLINLVAVTQLKMNQEINTVFQRDGKEEESELIFLKFTC